MTLSYRAPRIRLADEATRRLIRKHEEEKIVPKEPQGSLEPLSLSLFFHTLSAAQCHGSLTKKKQFWTDALAAMDH